MQELDLASLTTQVLAAAFFISLLFGVLVQRTHFCTMGAISDAVNIGDWTRMRQWTLAIGTAMVGFAVLAGLGLVDPARTLYAAPRWPWLSAAVGGLLFGFGMVLGSGCGSKMLVRIGGGNLRSIVVFLVMGFAAMATLKGITAIPRATLLDPVAVEFGTVANLPHLLAAAWQLPVAEVTLWLGVGMGLVVVVWSLAQAEMRHFENWLAGVGVGLLLVAMWWVSGHMGHLAEHPQTLEDAFLATNSGRAEALSFVAPVAYVLDWLILFSDKSKVLTLGIVSVFGVVAGSFLMARLSGNFRWEGFGGTEDLANHLAGAVLMGVGGVTAMGCTIGQGLSGISTLSLTSVVAVAGIVVGALLGFRYQMWRLDRHG